MVASSHWRSERCEHAEPTARGVRSWTWPSGSARAALSLCFALVLATEGRAEPAPDPAPRTEPHAAPAAEKPLLLVARGQCPNAEAAAQHLAPLLRRHRLVATAEGDASVAAHLSDEGARFRVEVESTDRLVDEPLRDCLERARIAAVLIAMALEPPIIVSEEPSPPAPTPPPQPPAPRSDASRVTFDVEAYALLAFGVDPGSVGPAVGPLVALRGGLDGWFARYSLGYVFARELTVSAGSATLARLPMDLTVGYSWPFDPFALEASLGLAADPLFVSAAGLENSQDEVRFDVGPRAALATSVGPRSLKGVAVARAAWFPRNYELSANRPGQAEPARIGETPSLWLELALGLRFELR